MNRRTFIATTAATLTALAIGGLPTLAQEATPTQEATPEGSQYELVFEGMLVKANREFETGSLRLDGAMQYSAIVAIFDTDTHAKEGFEKAAEIIDAITKENKLKVLERDKLSAPKLGKDRAAEYVKVESEGTKFNVTVFRAYEGKVLHVWSGVGLADPSVELLKLVEDHVTFDNVSPKNDDAVLDLLPELDDMPSGFKQTEEEVTRG